MNLSLQRTKNLAASCPWHDGEGSENVSDKSNVHLSFSWSNNGTLSKEHTGNTTSTRAKMIPYLRMEALKKLYPVGRHIPIQPIHGSTSPCSWNTPTKLCVSLSNYVIQICASCGANQVINAPKRMMASLEKNALLNISPQRHVRRLVGSGHDLSQTLWRERVAS